MRILVVEDGEFARELIAMQLQSLGHEVQTAETGTTGWERIQDGDFDVVISDLMMPGMNGIELCAKLRAEPQPHYTYFILLTAIDDPEQFLAGMRAGADDYLDKSSEPGVLEARLIVAERFTRLHQEVAEKAQQLEEANRGLKKLNGDLHRLSRHDSLTGLGNRLLMTETLQHVRGMAERYGRSFCAAILDVDHFKAYNDSYGHLAGDEVLAKVSEALKGASRATDMLFRYGGEEFLILLPETMVDEAVLAVERVREAVARESLVHEHAPEGHITLSAGVSQLATGREANIESWLKSADDALYRAKEEGRNRVVAA